MHSRRARSMVEIAFHVQAIRRARSRYYRRLLREGLIALANAASQRWRFRRSKIIVPGSLGLARSQHPRRNRPWR